LTFKYNYVDSLSNAATGDVDVQFVVKLTNACAINEITATPTTLPDIDYQIIPTPTTTTVTIPSFSKSVSSCNVTKTLKYYNKATSAWVTAGTGSPTWILLVDSSLNLKIKTSDTSFHGTSVAFKYSFVDSLSTETLGSVDVVFVVTLTNACAVNEITTVPSTLPDITYQINTSPTITTVTIPVSSKSVSACNITKMLKYHDTASNTWVTAATGSPAWIFSVDGSLNLKIKTSDASFSGKSLTFKYNFFDTASTSTLGSVDVKFTVTLVSPCAKD
jgi:hypothetical protein